MIGRTGGAVAPGGVSGGSRQRGGLAPGSLFVGRLGDWGALEEASHIFYEWRAGGEGEPAHWELVGGARYMHLWQWTPAGPRLLTSYSYDHGAAWESRRPLQLSRKLGPAFDPAGFSGTIRFGRRATARAPASHPSVGGLQAHGTPA